MDADALHEVMSKFVLVLVIIWGMFLVPTVLMVLMAMDGHVHFGVEGSITSRVFYYNIVSYPFVLVIASAISWTCLHYKKYWTAIGFALVPLVNVFVEIIAADIALFFS